MSNKLFLSQHTISEYASRLWGKLIQRGVLEFGTIKCYGIPRGGIPVAYLMKSCAISMSGLCEVNFDVVDDIAEANLIVDDIIDTGETLKRAKIKAVGLPVAGALIEKPTKGTWYVFPWEETVEASAEDIVTRQLQFIGEDVKRDGLLDTPSRVVRAWGEMFRGYNEQPSKVLGTVFENDQGYDEMIILRDIEFYSTCEHHLLPFFGKAHIAYLPSDKVVGISKLARLVDMYAKRAQIQERMTQQIADAIQGNLAPKGVAVIVEAQHLCMLSRGVQKQNSVMVTSAIKGSFTEDSARMEFLLLRR